MRAAGLVSLIMLLVCESFGQNGTADPSFEVASVRPYSDREKGEIGTSGGPGTRDPGHFVGRGTSLHIYLCYAFPVSDCNQQISGPSWIENKYDVIANVPAGTTKDQFRSMLQNLLVERFQLKLHHETRTVPVYELVVAKGGPKLKVSVKTGDGEVAPVGTPGKVEHDAEGFPVLAAGRKGFLNTLGPGPHSHSTSQQQTMQDLARFLSRQYAAGRQVIDKTELSGEYDFRLSFDLSAQGSAGNDDAPGLILEDALEQQLGLKLVNGKAPFDFVIIDRGEKAPIEN